MNEHDVLLFKARLDLEISNLRQLYRAQAYLRRHGLDRSFMAVYDDGGFLTQYIGVRLPAMESLSYFGNKYSKSTILALEGIAGAIGSSIKAIFKVISTTIKTVSNGIANVWARTATVFGDYEKRIERLRKSLAVRKDKPRDECDDRVSVPQGMKAARSKMESIWTDISTWISFDKLDDAAKQAYDDKVATHEKNITECDMGTNEDTDVISARAKADGFLNEATATIAKIKSFKKARETFEKRAQELQQMMTKVETQAVNAPPEKIEHQAKEARNAVQLAVKIVNLMTRVLKVFKQLVGTWVKLAATFIKKGTTKPETVK